MELDPALRRPPSRLIRATHRALTTIKITPELQAFLKACEEIEEITWGGEEYLEVKCNEGGKEKADRILAALNPFASRRYRVGCSA